MATLLADEGVSITILDNALDAAANTDENTDENTTVVVANGDRLSDDEARALRDAPHARLVLLRPNSLALRAFDVAATATGAVDARLAPSCPDRSATLAGPVKFSDMRAAYAPSEGRSAVTCYAAEPGFGYLRTTAAGKDLHLVAGGWSNADLDLAGNAALGMNVLGSQPNLVWLMAQRSATVPDDPTLLPAWWQMAVVQAFLGIVVVAVWRGRRLGPILVEALPVTIRAAETVEGHGRLYHRISARERAAEALREGSRRRLAAVLGQAGDPHQFAELVTRRSGTDVRRVYHMLFGPVPRTDSELIQLGIDLDQLEQEARRL